MPCLPRKTTYTENEFGSKIDLSEIISYGQKITKKYEINLTTSGLFSKIRWDRVFKPIVWDYAFEHQDEILAGKTIYLDIPFSVHQKKFKSKIWWEQTFRTGETSCLKIPLSNSQKKTKLPKVFVSRCHRCNKIFARFSINGKLSVCNNCKKEHALDLKKIRRGAKTCLYCGKPLPRNCPKNRKYCLGGACCTAAWRKKKRNLISPGLS